MKNDEPAPVLVPLKLDSVWSCQPGSMHDHHEDKASVNYEGEDDEEWKEVTSEWRFASTASETRSIPIRPSLS